MAPIMELDYTQLSTCFTCPMKWYLMYIKGLRKKSVDERDIDKLFGSKVHKCLEDYYKTGDRDFVSKWQDFVDLDPSQKEFHKTKANGIALCDKYITHYSGQDSGMEIMDVEMVERTPISPSLIWVAKLDTVVRLNGNIYSMEHKTTGKFDPRTYWKQFDPNMQMSGQVYTIEKKYGQCSGVLVNVLVSGYRQRAYKGEPAGFHCKFERDIINRNPRQTLDFKDNVSKGAERVQELLNTPELITKNEASCGNWKGCAYREICMTSFGIELDDQIVEVLYDVVDPKAYLKEEKGVENGTDEAVLST